MKLGIYSPYLDTLSGGEKYILTVAECLSRENDVYIIWDDLSIRERARSKFDIDLSKVNFCSDFFSKKNNLIKRFNKTRNFDAIIYLSNGSIPLVFCKLYLHFQFPVPWIKLNLLTKIKMLRVKKIICNSIFTKKYIDDKFNSDSVVLYPPVDTEKMKPAIKKNNAILTVGRFSRLENGSDFKKHDFMIHIFKQMIDKKLLKNWKFAIVTSYFYSDKIYIDRMKKEAKDYPIFFYENVDRKILVKLYEESKIYWHAAGFAEEIDKYPERAEHFGISTVEAMAGGCVPVVIDLGGQNEIVKDDINGYVWSNALELEEKTKIIIDNHKVLSRLSNKAVESVNGYSKSRFCDEVKDLII